MCIYSLFFQKQSCQKKKSSYTFQIFEISIYFSILIELSMILNKTLGNISIIFLRKQKNSYQITNSVKNIVYLDLTLASNIQLPIILQITKCLGLVWNFSIALMFIVRVNLLVFLLEDFPQSMEIQWQKKEQKL